MASLTSSPFSEMIITSLRWLNRPTTYSRVLAEMNIMMVEAMMMSSDRLNAPAMKMQTLTAKLNCPMGMFQRCFRATAMMSVPPLLPRVRSIMPTPAPCSTPATTAA